MCEAGTKSRGASNMNIHCDRFTDCNVEITLGSDCLGCLNWPGRGGGGVLSSKHIYVISRSLPVADNWIDEDEELPLRIRI